MSEFAEVVERQYRANMETWGDQPIDTLVIAAGEEYGEVCRAYLEATNLRTEVIHLAAVLFAIYLKTTPLSRLPRKEVSL